MKYDREYVLHSVLAFFGAGLGSLWALLYCWIFNLSYLLVLASFIIGTVINEMLYDQDNHLWIFVLCGFFSISAWVGFTSSSLSWVQTALIGLLWCASTLISEVIILSPCYSIVRELRSKKTAK
jgi:hypothetical protein